MPSVSVESRQVIRKRLGMNCPAASWRGINNIDIELTEKGSLAVIGDLHRLPCPWILPSPKYTIG